MSECNLCCAGTGKYRCHACTVIDLRRELAEAHSKIERMSCLATPDRNMAEQIARYLDGRAEVASDPSMERVQLRNAARWMRDLKPAPDMHYAVQMREALNSAHDDILRFMAPTMKRKQMLDAIDAALAKNPTMHAAGGQVRGGDSGLTGSAPAGRAPDEHLTERDHLDLRDNDARVITHRPRVCSGNPQDGFAACFVSSVRRCRKFVCLQARKCLNPPGDARTVQQQEKT